MYQEYSEKDIQLLAHPPLDKSTEPGKKTNKIIFNLDWDRVCFVKQNDAIRLIPIKLSDHWVDIGCYSVQVQVLEKVLKYHKARFGTKSAVYTMQ